MSEHEPKLISIIMPAFRQARVIDASIRDVVASVRLIHIPFELLVVIDGIEDDRQTFLKAKAFQGKNVKVIGYAHNHGKGYAVRFGMARSIGDIILFIDAGGDINSSGIAMLMTHYQWYKADIVIGSKRHRDSKVNYPWYRKVLSWSYQQLVRVLFGLNIRDSQVGLKLFRRNVLEDVLPRLLVKRFAFDIEILAVAYSLGYTKIYEAPVELQFSHMTTITSLKLWKEVANMLWDTVAVFYRLKILRYYQETNKRRWRYDPELNFRVNVG